MAQFSEKHPQLQQQLQRPRQPLQQQRQIQRVLDLAGVRTNALGDVAAVDRNILRTVTLYICHQVSLQILLILVTVFVVRKMWRCFGAFCKIIEKKTSFKLTIQFLRCSSL